MRAGHLQATGATKGFTHHIFPHVLQQKNLYSPHTRSLSPVVSTGTPSQPPAGETHATRPGEVQLTRKLVRRETFTV